MKKNNKGFTLVELLVVIAIIGILAVVAVPALFKNIEKGKIADLEADISAIRSAALSVYADTSTFPTDKEIISSHGKLGDNLINAELEGLSNPFNAKYTTEVSGSTTKNVLLLKIAPTTNISLDGAKKLKQDLGNKYVTSGGTALDRITSGDTIYIELLSE